MSGAPILLPQRHAINLIIALAIVAGIVYLVAGAPETHMTPEVFPVHHGIVFRHRVPDYYSDWRGRHACRRVHAQFLFGLGCCRYRLHPVQFGIDYHRFVGRFFRRNPVIYYV